jgi:alkylhydroperoxidase family enzyme
MDTRIAPVEAPFSVEEQELLDRMMPRGTPVPPIALFRTFVRNPVMSRAMGPWGGYELGKTLSIGPRDRELVILRVCARCRCEYEWGVHATLVAGRAGLSEAEILATAAIPFDEHPWSAHDRTVLRAVDALHENADLPDELWRELAAEFTEPQLLDLLMLAGWYHAIAYTANGARVPLEHWAARFPGRT